MPVIRYVTLIHRQMLRPTDEAEHCSYTVRTSSVQPLTLLKAAPAHSLDGVTGPRAERIRLTVRNERGHKGGAGCREPDQGDPSELVDAWSCIRVPCEGTGPPKYVARGLLASSLASSRARWDTSFSLKSAD